VDKALLSPKTQAFLHFSDKLLEGGLLEARSPIPLIYLGFHQIVCFDGRDRQGINALTKKQCRINRAVLAFSRIDPALFDCPVVLVPYLSPAQLFHIILVAMTTQILQTKLYIPPTRLEVVPRPRLMAVLNRTLTAPLTLVSAPAGFGKTTLVANWMQQQPQAVAWLSLDESDNDPVRFLSYVVAALNTAVSNFPSDALNMLQNRQSVVMDVILTALLNEITAVSHPILLVLDDYHLIKDDDVHQSLTFLLDHMPDNLHLILTTRSDPPLPLSRLRGRRQLVEIRQSDLAFSLEETTQFLNGLMKLNLSVADVAALTERTEGWITGLQMAAVSMQGSSDIAGFVQAFTGSNRYVLDYLMEEVWQRQSPAIQDFLMKTAVLDELTGPLCDWMMGDVDWRPKTGDWNNGLQSPVSSQQVLMFLDRTNLFVIPLDDERQWYRYHHLFVDLLRQRLRNMRPDLEKQLHHRAGDWYAENGRFSTAINHYLQAESFAQAAALIEQVAEDYLMRSEVETLLDWIEALPDELVRERPLLYVYQAGAYLINGQSLIAIESQLEAALAGSEGATRGEVNMMRGLMAVFRGDAEESKILSELALRILPSDNLFLRSLVSQNMAFAIALHGDVQMVIDKLMEAASLSEDAGNVMSQVICLSHVGEFHIAAGRLRAARDVYEQCILLAVDEAKRPLPIAGIPQMGLGEVYREWNQLDKAEKLLTQGLENISRWGVMGALDGHVWLSRLRQAQGDFSGAVAELEAAAKIAIKFDSSQMDDYLVGVHRARLEIQQGRVDTAVHWIKSVGLVDKTLENTPYYLWELGRMTLVRLYLAQQSYSTTLNILTDLLPRAQRLGRTGVIIDALCLQAIAYFHTKQQAKALTALLEALTLAEPEAYIHTFREKGEPMQQLLVELLKKPLPTNLQAYVQKLLSYQSSVFSPQSSVLFEQLSDRELEVLRLIAAGYTNREIADQLVVAVSTIKTHINNIYGKLGVTRRTQAITRAQELNLL
jgi:LuxR family maltose regulon positive regulatory protein